MIYANKRGTLSRHLGVYVRANTGNPTGWRPQYKPLGELQPLPDWKQVVQARERQMRTSARVNHAVEQAKSRHMARVDAHVRGDRGMSGIGLLDNNSLMSQGANYVFYFTYSSFGINPSQEAVQAALNLDSNFGTPVPFDTGDGRLGVSFVYSGRGSTVLNAGAEMQKVINDNAGSPATGNIFSASVTFAGADGGAASAPSQVTSIPTAVQNAANQQQQQQPSSPFNFLTGMGSGAALAIGGIVLLLALRN